MSDTVSRHGFADRSDALEQQLDARGCAMLPGLLDADQSRDLIELYGSGEEHIFRKTVVMARHGFGRGEYRYLTYPLPALVQQLRTTFYSFLVPIANAWQERMGLADPYPSDHAAYLRRCHDAGQTRPTPLLLSYGTGDYNCLHQDLYGAHRFPLQLAVLLSEPDRDFDGGEFILTEQRPRMQSKAAVVPLQAGDAVIFATDHRPVRGTRGDYRVTMRHGVSEIRRGNRYTLGVIFHDAV